MNNTQIDLDKDILNLFRNVGDSIPWLTITERLSKLGHRSSSVVQSANRLIAKGKIAGHGTRFTLLSR
jgi:hypothetical protein